MEHKFQTFALSAVLALIFANSANAVSLMDNVDPTDTQQKVTVSQLDYSEMYPNQDTDEDDDYDYDYEDDC